MKTSDKPEYLFYLILLTSFFFLLEISFFVQCNKAYLDDFNVVASNLHLPLTLLPGILFFIAAQVALHVIFCMLIWLLTYLLAEFLHLTSKRTIQLAISLWVLGILSAFAANQVFFPYSKFADLTAILLWTPFIAQVFFLITGTLCGSVGLLALIALFKLFFLFKKPHRYAVVILSIVGGGYLLFATHTSHTQKNNTQPNVIIIGADALRPDFVGFFDKSNHTPFYDAFLKHAVIFDRAFTPLARTFPSWISILTGNYPTQTGARSDLQSPSDLHLQQTLPKLLQAQGYKTFYATDESRFSNMDKAYGFDQIIAPPMTLNDFLLGTFNDFPFSNLIVNTALGEWLFPHSYANRPVYFTYEPNTFLKKVSEQLDVDTTQPVFLAIHFCLAHAPYLWATTPGVHRDALYHYQASVTRVDQQIKDFMAILKHKGLLDHAIVILLSDHGEAFEQHGDRITQADHYLPTPTQQKMPHFYAADLKDETVDESVGHGGDVLSFTQFRTLLGIRFYGLKMQVTPRTVDEVVSLIDLKPTILQLLHMPDQNGAGQSLAPLLLGKANQLPMRPIFLESDFTPEAIRTVYPDLRAAMLVGVRLFQIDPLTTRLTVKPSMANMILNSKQFAIIQGDWILALYPQNSRTRQAVLVNIKTGLWTTDLRSSFAMSAPINAMQHALFVHMSRTD